MAFSGGGQCWPTVAEAAQAQCVALQGVTSGGAMTCDGVLSSDAIGAVLRYRVISPSGVATLQDVGIVTAPCEFPTFEGYWAPILGAAIVAFITIRSLLAVRDIFRRDSL